MKKPKIILLSTLILTMFILSACNSNNKSAAGAEKKIINVGTSSGLYSELFLNAVKPTSQKTGYTIKVVKFSELLLVNVAINEGSIDLNMDQHTAYFSKFNKVRGAKLTSLTPIPMVPAGFFQRKRAPQLTQQKMCNWHSKGSFKCRPSLCPSRESRFD